MRDVFQRIRLDAAYARVEAARRSATRWSTVATASAILLWVWARAPSFDIVPAFIGFFVKLAAMFSYGLFGPADSFVFRASSHVNLGYAIVFGPLILLLTGALWYGAERRFLEQSTWLAERPDLAGAEPYSSRRRRLAEIREIRRRRAVSVAIKGLILVAASIVLILRFTDLRSSPTVDQPQLAGQVDAYCGPIREAGCRCTETWAEPWPDAEQSAVSWWLPGRDWCIGGGSGLMSNFPAVLPHSFFEKQIRERGSLATEIAERLMPELAGEPGRAETVFLFDNRANPYDAFPHIYPWPTLWANTAILIATVGLWLRMVWGLAPVCAGRESWNWSSQLRLWRRWHRLRGRRGRR